MSELQILQDQLLAAVMRNDASAIAYITVGGRPANHRALMAGGTVFGKLGEDMSARFATVEKRVGTANFAPLARDYCVQHPPLSPTMNDFGAHFSGFVETHPLCAEYPDLSDLARFDWLMLQSAFAPIWNEDDPGLTVSLTPTADLCLASSLQVLETTYPVTDIRDALEEGTDITSIDLIPAPRAYAIYSKGDDSRVRPVSAPVSVFLRAVLDGKDAHTAYADAVIGQDEVTFKLLLRAEVIDAPFSRLKR